MENSQFESDAGYVITSFRDSVAAIFENIGANRFARPISISRLLGIDMNLAWKLSNLFKHADPLACGKYIPGESAVKIFLTSAAELGCSTAKLTEVEETYSHFLELKSIHAGSRKELDMMLASVSEEGKGKAALLHRRKAYEANGYIFGVQTRTQLSTNILLPSKDNPQMLDCIKVRGHIDFRNIRPDVSWRISTSYVYKADGEMKNTPRREPVFQREPENTPVIREFSSDPLPSFLKTVGIGGSSQYSIAGETVGNTSLITIYTAEAVRNAGAYYALPTENALRISYNSKTPTENLILDIFALKDDFANCFPEASMMSELFASTSFKTYTKGDRLPLTEKPVELNSHRGIDRLTEVPSYPEVIHKVFCEIGRKPSDFRHFRLKIQYPPVPASIVMMLMLPEKDLSS